MTDPKQWRMRAHELALAVRDEREYCGLALAIASARTTAEICDVMWEIRRVQALQEASAPLRTQAVRAQLWKREAL